MKALSFIFALILIKNFLYSQEKGLYFVNIETSKGKKVIKLAIN